MALPEHFSHSKVRILVRDDSYGLIQQLLMQAGDVETNPGPGISILIQL